MKKILLLSLIVGFGIMATGCEKKKSTDEQLKENTVKEAELLKKSATEKADKVGNAIEKGIDKLKK
jgi:hypothetical protein